MEDEDQVGQGTAGEWTKQQGEGGVDGFVELFVSCVCVSGAAWLGLACLLAPAAVVHESLWSGGVGWGWVEVAGRAVLGDTAVHLPERTLGASHTPDDDLA